jgi:hypothetical protein
MGAAAGNGLGTTLNYPRDAAGNGRAQLSSIFDAQRALLRATAWAPRSITCSAQRAAPRVTFGRNDQVPAMHNERHQRPCAVRLLTFFANGEYKLD